MKLKEIIERAIAQEANRIIRETCEEHLVGRSDLMGHSTFPHLVNARRALIAKLTQAGFTITQMSRAIGRNRSTIRYWNVPEEREYRLGQMLEYGRRKRKHDLARNLQASRQNEGSASAH